MTTPNTPPEPPTAPVARRSRWRRPRGRGAVIGAALVALLVVAGVAAALLIPGHGPGRKDREDFGGPDIGLSGGFGELDGLGGPGPAGPDRGGPGRGGPRGGAPLDRGLGDDTLLAGTVVSTADGSIIITPDGGAQRTIRTDGDTRVRGNGNTGLGDLQAGERVVLRISGTGEAATAVTILAPQARVTGTVTALTGDTATVTAIDGLTVTADVTALSQKPAVGDLVVLTGVATNGTTLTADGIRILPR